MFFLSFRHSSTGGQQQQGMAGQAQAGGRGRGQQRGGKRGRGGMRGGRGGRGRGRGRGGQQQGPAPSREELDNQLDAYMSKTKTGLDAELDAYMAAADTALEWGW